MRADGIRYRMPAGFRPPASYADMRPLCTDICRIRCESERA